MFFEKDKKFFLFSCVYFKTVSFILKMGDPIPMTFGEIRTFHPDWYGERSPGSDLEISAVPLSRSAAPGKEPAPLMNSNLRCSGLGCDQSHGSAVG